jgi:hypothetical protein
LIENSPKTHLMSVEDVAHRPRHGAGCCQEMHAAQLLVAARGEGLGLRDEVRKGGLEGSGHPPRVPDGREMGQVSVHFAICAASET